jgi:hypothetical protein
MDLRIDNELIRERWQEFKLALSRTWHKISDMEWEHTDRDGHEISSLIHRHYGGTRADVNRSLSGMYQEFLDQERMDQQRMDWEAGRQPPFVPPANSPNP